MPFIPDDPQAGRFVPDGPKLGPKDIPDQAPPRAPYQEPTRMERLRGSPESLLSVLSGIPAQLAGRGAAALQAFSPSNYGTQEGAARAQEAGAKVAEAMTYQPRSRGAQANVEQLGRTLEASKIEGLGPVLPMGGVGATKVLSGRKPSPAAVAANRAGYALTPDDAEAGFLAKTASGLSGEAKLARQVSNKNAALATSKIAADLEIPEGTPLTIPTLQEVRKTAAGAYAAVRQTGRVTADDQYLTEIDKLGERFRSAAKDFPDLAPADVEKVVGGLFRESFDANSAVDMIGQLRESADAAFASRNPGLGKVMRGGADALEAQLERHLVATGQDATLISKFKGARERIAKSYMAEKSLVGEEVNPQAYRKALDKGKPLTGAGREIAENAKEFERSFQKPTHMNVGSPTWSDVIMAGLSGGKSFLKEGLLLGARPGVRALLASRPYQNLQASQPHAAVPVPPPEAAAALGLTPMLAPPVAPPQEQIR